MHKVQHGELDKGEKENNSKVFLLIHRVWKRSLYAGQQSEWLTAKFLPGPEVEEKKIVNPYPGKEVIWHN